MASQRARIQAALYAEAQTGPFYAASTDPGTRLLTVDEDTAVTPAAVFAQEHSLAFREPERNRRRYRQEARSWRWTLACSFNREVSVEAFWRRLTETPLGLVRTAELPQTTVRLVSVDLVHPAQGSPSTGTQAVFHLEADEWPV